LVALPPPQPYPPKSGTTPCESRLPRNPCLSSIPPRQEFLDTTLEHLEGFALEGLRTLMVATKEFAEEDFERWDEVWYLTT